MLPYTPIDYVGHDSQHHATLLNIKNLLVTVPPQDKYLLDWANLGLMRTEIIVNTLRD